MRTRREVIKEAELVVAMLYSISNTRNMSPDSITVEVELIEARMFTKLATLNWVLGPDAVTL